MTILVWQKSNVKTTLLFCTLSYVMFDGWNLIIPGWRPGHSGLPWSVGRVWEKVSTPAAYWGSMKLVLVYLPLALALVSEGRTICWLLRTETQATGYWPSIWAREPLNPCSVLSAHICKATGVHALVWAANLWTLDRQSRPLDPFPGRDTNSSKICVLLLSTN